MNRVGWRDLLPLGVVLLLAATLRVGWPKLTEFKFSEARLEALALELTRQGRLPLVGVPSSAGFDHSPVSVYLYLPAFAWTSSPIPATIYGGLINVAAVALCWHLARRWPGGGRRAAIVASLLLAVSPWAVVSSRKIWQVAFVPLLTLCFVGWMVSALVAGRRWSLCWGLLTYFVLVQVHPSAFSLAPALLLWLIVFRRQVRLVPALVGSILGLVTAVPFLIHQIQAGWPVLKAAETSGSAWDLEALHQTWDAVTGRGLATLAGRAFPSLGVLPELASAYNVLGWLTVLALSWLAWGMISDWVKRRSSNWQATQVALMLVSWMVVPVALNLRHSMDLYLHFFLLLVPAACLILGLGVEALANRQGFGDVAARRRRAIAIGIASVVAVVAALQLTGLVLMGRLVATHDTTGGFGTPLGRYMSVTARAISLVQESKASEVLVVGQGDSVAVDEIPAIFHVLLLDRVPYRFVDGRVAAVFPSERAIALLAPEPGEAAAWYESAQLLQVDGGFRLLCLEGQLPALSLASLAGETLFQNGIELRSYAWEPATVSGRPERFILLWRVAWQSPADTHFFVHLLDETGERVGQRDMVGYPAAYRRQGDEVISLFDITRTQTEAPPASYRVRVGMYTYPDVTNVPVIDIAGNPIIDAVEVGPLTGKP